MSALPHALLYPLAFAVPLVASLFLTPRAARLARQLGIMDLPETRKFHKEATPYLGGVAVAVALVLVGGVAAGASGQLLTVLICGLAIAALGVIDDWKTVRLGAKVLLEIAAGLALWLAGIRAGLFDVYALDLIVTVLWTVAITNSINLIDNMDGLSSGVGVLASLTFFVAAAVQGNYLVAAFALALAGSSLGFLRHNFPPATIFLGDAGSLFVGFLLAAIGLKLDLVGNMGLIRAAVPVLILGVPILDMCLVVVTRLREGRAVYSGATDHSSHRLAGLGLTTKNVALLTYTFQLTCCGAALLVLHVSGRAALGVVVIIGVAAAGMFLWLMNLAPALASQTALSEAVIPGREEQDAFLLHASAIPRLR